MKNKILAGIALFSVLFILAGCATQSIREIKSEEYIGKQVAVSGTVEATIKIGSLSGFTLKDKDGDSIGVKSAGLPVEGSKVTIRGVLMKDSIFGYYIQDSVHTKAK